MVKQMESNLKEKEILDEGLNEEMGQMKDPEEKLSECNVSLRAEIEHLKDKLEKGNDESLKLKEEVKRLENELRLQKERTANDEVIMLRNELKRAIEAEENSKQAMDEFALVIKEVASEANHAKEKLSSAESHIQILNNKAEELLLAWNEKETEFIKCLKQEEDEKAKLQEQNHKLLESLNDLQQESVNIKDETERIKELFKECFEEAETAKAQSSELMICLEENERKLTLFTQENVRLRRAYESKNDENMKEKRQIPSSSNQELASDDSEQEKLGCSKKDKKSHQVEEDPKKPACKKESKSHSHGGEEKEQKRLHKKETKIKKEHRMSHVGEEKEMKKIKKDSSLDKEMKLSNTHAKSYAIICFDPMAMLPIPGISSYNKHKEGGGDANDKDDKLTDSIFDIVESVPKHQRQKQHRRTTSVDDDKSISSEEFEHEEIIIPHLDDMEVERAGAHATKRGVLLRKFGDLWKRKNQGHAQNNHHNAQNHNFNQKDVTT